MGLLGAHISIQGGVQNAPERGAAIGCESIQIFTRNQRQWASKPLQPEQIQDFKTGIKKFNIQAVLTHSIYLINLASPDPELQAKSEKAFLDEMDRCELLGIPYLVFHPGSHKQTTKQDGINRLTERLQNLLSKRPKQKVTLLIENTVGAGDILGANFEQIAEIRDQVGMTGRLEVCFDTAHAFAAGYDLRAAKGCLEILDQFDSHIGLNHLKAFHLNDSRSELASRRDLHEHIGQGHIGLETFRCIINDKRFRKHPMVLETPGDEGNFRSNLQLLFSLRE
jgi:deoxyribonuclease-4